LYVANRHIPDGYHAVNPYLHVQGAERLIAFVTETFAAVELSRHTDHDGRIRHAEFKIGDSIIECSDARDDFPAMQSGLHVYVPDTDACFLKAVAAGATVLYEPQNMPYGERSAGVKDPLGNNWYIATYLRQESS